MSPLGFWHSVASDPSFMEPSFVDRGNVQTDEPGDMALWRAVLLFMLSEHFCNFSFVAMTLLGFIPLPSLLLPLPLPLPLSVLVLHAQYAWN